MLRSLVGSEMCIRDRCCSAKKDPPGAKDDPAANPEGSPNRTMPPDIEARFIAVFKAMDKDNSGTVDFEEIREILRSRTMASKIFSSHDLDNDKRITLQEWLAFFTSKHEDGRPYEGEQGLIEDAEILYVTNKPVG
eukprot:TRINITY_DN24012_c0_g1_i1.p1 TRINITY_DN24012_c0_g1~~TRINITY_DN24012_c0_g1_i1.p1  ORF type:complete len:136 (-),score=35.06 TRINITY_DN24012_c0_g1_i1:267-674(-)